jgi:hypothetical protein
MPCGDFESKCTDVAVVLRHLTEKVNQKCTSDLGSCPHQIGTSSPSRRPGFSPIRLGQGGNRRWSRYGSKPGLPPWRCLIALREVVGMAMPGPNVTDRCMWAHSSPIPETCPSGEDISSRGSSAAGTACEWPGALGVRSSRGGVCLLCKLPMEAATDWITGKGATSDKQSAGEVPKDCAIVAGLLDLRRTRIRPNRSDQLAISSG